MKCFVNNFNRQVLVHYLTLTACSNILKSMETPEPI